MPSSGNFFLTQNEYFGILFLLLWLRVVVLPLEILLLGWQIFSHFHKVIFQLNTSGLLSHLSWKSLVWTTLIRQITDLSQISTLSQNYSSAYFYTGCGCSNFNPFQSAYRTHYSTETALLHTLDKIYSAADVGRPTVFPLISVQHLMS